MLKMGTFGNGKYVDRGDPENYDFVKEDLITDQTWHDLDLSSIVPAGIRLVHLRIRLATPSLAGFQFRRKGNTNAVNAAVVKTQVANVYYYKDVIIPCGLDRIVQYLANNVPWTTLDIAVRGWFKGGG